MLLDNATDMLIKIYNSGLRMSQNANCLSVAFRSREMNATALQNSFFQKQISVRRNNKDHWEYVTIPEESVRENGNCPL